MGATDALCTGGTGRNYVAAISTSTAGALSYNASIPKTTGYRVDALALSADGSTLYAGGNFSDDLIATDATSGLHSSWDPNPGGPVESLAVSGSTIYAGGAFSDIGGQQRGRIAALRALDATAIETWNPGTNDPSGTSAVYALAVSDNPNDGSHEVYAGGDFTSTGGVPRDNLAAIDQNGVPTAWNPGADSSVQALALSADEGTLYVGGVFTTLAGQTRNKLGALTTGTTPTLTSWNPNVDPATGNVAALVIDGPDVYAGGSFTTVGGATHNRLAAIDATTGVVRSSFAASVDDEVYTLAVGRGTLYAGGLFLHAGLSNGTPRQRLAAFAETDGSLQTWNPAPDGAVRALAYSLGNAASSDLLYVGGDFTTAGGQPRGRIAAISPTDGTATAWNPGADASVYAIAVAGPRIYVGGDFQSLHRHPEQPAQAAGRARHRLRSLDRLDAGPRRHGQRARGPRLDPVRRRLVQERRHQRQRERRHPAELRHVHHDPDQHHDPEHHRHPGRRPDADLRQGPVDGHGREHELHLRVAHAGRPDRRPDRHDLHRRQRRRRRGDQLPGHRDQHRRGDDRRLARGLDPGPAGEHRGAADQRHDRRRRHRHRPDLLVGLLDGHRVAALR